MQTKPLKINQMTITFLGNISVFYGFSLKITKKEQTQKMK